MSHKRSQLSAETPAAKRYLNSALAAELQTLRISRGNARVVSPTRHVFGASVTPSPFLTPLAIRVAPPSSDGQVDKQVLHSMRFGTAFAESLSNAASEMGKGVTVSEVTTPGSPSSSSSSLSMAVDENVVGRENDVSVALDDGGEGGITIEDMEPPVDSENRLVVYRPPVRTPMAVMSRVNACLPEGQYLMRNPRADEWVVREAQSERVKRKLALVPWKGDIKKICDIQRCPAKVIPMPWRNSEATVEELDDDNMEIEDVS